MSSISEILVFIWTVIICFDLSDSQDPTWLKNNFNECLQWEHDRLIMTALIKRNTNTTFTAKSALFQIRSNGDIIKECMLSDLDKRCERKMNKDCYCESQNEKQVIIVFNPVAKLSYIGKNVTVKVPCVDTVDSITSSKLNISSSFDKSPSLTVNNEEVDLSRQIVSSKVPALIKFYCDTSSQPHCHAHMKRNNQIIDNGSHCVSFTETSSSYVPYTIFSTHCNHTSEEINFMFFPQWQPKKDRSPSLTVNNEEVDLSRQIVSSKVPVVINFCCDTSSQPNCHAHMKRNNQIIDNGSHCVSLNETSSSYVPYTIFSTQFNKTSEEMNFMFFPKSQPKKEIDDNARSTNMSEVYLYCFLMISAIVILRELFIKVISSKCPGIYNRFSVHSKEIKRLKKKNSTVQTDILELKEIIKTFKNTMSTMQTDSLESKEKNKTSENKVSMLEEVINTSNSKTQPQAIKEDFREEELNNIVAKRCIEELKKEEGATVFVSQEESKSH